MPIQVAKVRDFKGHTQPVYTLCSAVSTDSFYSAGADGMVVKWSIDEQDGELLAQFNHPIYSLYFHDNMLLCGGNNGTLTIVDTQSKLVIKNAIVHTAAIFDIRFHNGHFLLAHGNGFLTALDSNYEPVKNISISSKSLRKILPLNEDIYLTGSEGIIWKLNKELKVEKEKSADKQTIFALAFHEEKNILLSGGRDAVLKLWQDLEEITTINAHWFHINDISFSVSQQYFTTCSMDKTIKLWDAVNFNLLKVIDYEKSEAHRSSVNKILWIGINRFISCSDDRTIMCFEIRE